jgi:hypothetical protein
LQLQTSPASNNSPNYEHVKALSQDAKHANINTFTVKTSEAQLSRLSFAFRMHELFNWRTDGQKVFFLIFGNGRLFLSLFFIFFALFYLFIFVLTLVAVFTVCVRHMPLERQTLQSYSLCLLQIYNSC